MQKIKGPNFLQRLLIITGLIPWCVIWIIGIILHLPTMCLILGIGNPIKWLFTGNTIKLNFMRHKDGLFEGHFIDSIDFIIKLWNLPRGLLK